MIKTVFSCQYDWYHHRHSDPLVRVCIVCTWYRWWWRSSKRPAFRPLDRFYALLVQHQLVDVERGPSLAGRLDGRDQVRLNEDRVLAGPWVGGQSPRIDQWSRHRGTASAQRESHSWDGGALEWIKWRRFRRSATYCSRAFWSRNQHCLYYLIVYRNGIDFGEGTWGAVLLLKLGLIWLQHSDLAPPVEEQRNSAHP